MAPNNTGGGTGSVHGMGGFGLGLGDRATAGNAETGDTVTRVFPGAGRAMSNERTKGGPTL